MDNPQKKSATKYGFETAKVVAVAFEMGFIIALPIVVLGTIGKQLDDRHNTHWFVYIAIVISLAISVTWLFKRLSELARKLKEAARPNNSSSTKNSENKKE